MSFAIGLVARHRRGLRPRLHERHDQDAGGRDAAPEAAVPRPGAVGPRRQAPGARLVARAARLRRSVPVAADVADVALSRPTARRLCSSRARSRSKARRRRRATSRWRWRTAARACCSSTPTCGGPGLHRPLRLTNERGLSQVLIGQARVRDVIQRTVDPNLLAITAGRTPPNPSELLASERMKTLLSEPVARSVRLDRDRHAAGARRHRRGHPRAAGVRRDLRRRRGDDAPPPRRARARDDHVERIRGSPPSCSTRSISRETSTTIRATTATSTRTTTPKPRSDRPGSGAIASPARRHAVRVRRRIRLDGVRAGGGRRRARDRRPAGRGACRKPLARCRAPALRRRRRRVAGPAAPGSPLRALPVHTHHRPDASARRRRIRRTSASALDRSGRRHGCRSRWRSPCCCCS